MRSSAQELCYENKNLSKENIFYSLKHPISQTEKVQLWNGTQNQCEDFNVWEDSEIFNIPGIPTIQMYEDNDEESSWAQVWEHSQGMALTLSMTAYDRTYGN